MPTDPQNATDELNPAGLVYKLSYMENECVDPAPTMLNVHIYKYIQDGQVMTQVADDAGIAPFPMTATWMTANLNGGVSSSAGYVLGDNHGGAYLKYSASTSPMQAPADYTTSEVTDGSVVLPIGAQCVAGKYRLVGYKSGSTLAEAQAALESDSAPVFTDIISDRFVIVVNELCADQVPQEPVALSCPVGTTKTFLETVTVPATQTTAVLSANPLVNGTSYILKAYGTANAGDGIEFDARYSFRTPTSVSWTDSVSTYEGLGPTLLDLFYNGSTPWGAYYVGHSYEALVTGNGSQAQFIVNDSYAVNNAGELKVDIFTCAPAVQQPTYVTVSISKYIDGVHASAVNAGDTTFTMEAYYTGTSQELGYINGNNPYFLQSTSTTAFEATTLHFVPGFHYQTSEHINAVTGTSCESGTPFALVGYSYGDSLAAAQAMTPVMTAPDFTNLQSDKFVIVHNHKCGEVQGNTSVQVYIYKYLKVGNAAPTQIMSGSGAPSFPMTATWNATNISGTGGYGLENANGYTAVTSPLDVPADYTTSEVTNGSPVLAIGAACEANKYRLVGYKSGTSLANAQAAAVSATAPIYTDISVDQHVIVVNEDCDDVIGGSIPNGTLTIIKNTTSGNGTFNFNVDGTCPFEWMLDAWIPNVACAYADMLTLPTFVSLTTVGGTDTESIQLPPGNYDVNEIVPEGWDLVNSSCVYDGDSFGSPITDGENVTIYSNETVTCTFTNSPENGGGGPTTSSETVVVKMADLATGFGDVISNPTKWFFYNDNNDSINNALGGFVNGPATAPLGTGSAQVTLDAVNNRTNLATYAFSSTTLANITELKFSAYSHSGVAGPTESPYLVFNVSFTGADTWQKRLVYVPSANGAVPQDAWNTFDAINGGSAMWTWSGYVANGNMWPDGNTSEYRTWNQLKAAFPNISVRKTDSFMGVRVGEPGPTAYVGNMDKFVIGIKAGLNTHTKTFDFEPTTQGGGGDGGSPAPAAAPQGNGMVAGAFSTGSVLGANTSLPELPAGCDALIHTFMRLGKANNAAEVKLLQQFLNTHVGTNLPISGVFGPLTHNAVKKFQELHKAEVLTPWGLNAPTGFVYLTTQRWVNLVHCSTLNIPMPDLIPASQNPNI